jgi:phytoene dehydrogenase-like protein
MKLNFELFENFKEAASKCDLEVKPGSGYHSIKLPNGRYIFCWTPLNKMFHLYNYYENKEWDRALNHLRDNFDDFHLEVGGDDIEDMNLVGECFWDVNSDLSVDQIVNIIETLADDEKLNQKLVWNRIIYGCEE